MATCRARRRCGQRDRAMVRSIRTSHVKLAAIVAIAAVALWVAIPRAGVNVWSVRMAGSMMSNGVLPQEHDTGRLEYPREALWQGLAALTKGDTVAAVEWLARGVERDPTDAMSRLTLGRAYERQGLSAPAVAQWKAIGAWGEMIRAAQRAIRQSRWGDALLFLNAAEAHSPQDVVANEAQAFNGKADHSSAMSLLRQALGTWPKSPEVQSWRNLLGDYLGQEKRWAEAEDVYRDAIASSHGMDLARAHIGLGRALYYENKGLEAALTEIRRGIAMNPSKSDGYVALGDILVAQKRYAEADGWFVQGAQRDPGDVWIVARRVDCLLAEGRADAAVGVAREALVRFPSQAHLYYQLGQAYGRLGDVADAVSAAEKSVSLDHSRNPGYRLALASLSERAGRRQEAAAEYRSVLDLDPHNAVAVAGLARLGGNP